MSNSSELTPEAKEELKEQIKKIEDGIVAKIDKYNEEIKNAEGKETNLRNLQTKAYLVSEQYRKASRINGATDLSALESELNNLDTEIQASLNETLSSKNEALVSLQTLYREHVDYLSKVANGLKQEYDKLQAGSPVITDTRERMIRADNVKV